MNLPAHDHAPSRLGSTALAAVLAFAAACVVLQFARPDLDWRQAPMSFYLRGAHGAWLVAAYWVLGAGLVLLGIGCYRALAPGARSAAPLALFALGGAGVCVTASAGTNLPGHPPSFEGFVHGLAAQTAFLATTTAMLLQSWRLRLDAAMRPSFAPASALAVASFAALWGHALWRTAPRGLTQKFVIALVVAWLVLVAWRLARGAGSAGGSTADARVAASTTGP